MTFKQLLFTKKTAILDKWLKLVTETYPAESLGFLEHEKDRFANPVGHAITEGTASIYDELLGEMSLDKLAGHLDNIIRIRAVQEFSPSQAISFIFLLKKAVHDELLEEIREAGNFEEYLDFESKIDKVAMLALDIFTGCREKIHEIRVNEIKAEREKAFRLLKKADLVYYIPEKDSLKEGSQET